MPVYGGPGDSPEQLAILSGTLNYSESHSICTNSSIELITRIGPGMPVDLA